MRCTTSLYRTVETFSLTYTEFRANLARIWDQVISTREVGIIRRRGREDLAVLPASELRGLIETAHLLRSPRNAQRLLTALNRALGNEGKASTVEGVAEEFGLEPEA